MYGDLGDFVNALEKSMISEEVTPDAVAMYYTDFIAKTCLALASTWVIHPRTMKYRSVLRFGSGYRRPPQRQDDVHEQFILDFIPFETVNPEVIASVDEHIKTALKDLAEKSLAAWLFLPLDPHTEATLQNMDQMAKLPVVPSVLCSTKGFTVKSTQLPQTFDAQNPPWKLPAPEAVIHDSSRDRSTSKGHNGCISPGPPVGQRPSEFEKMQDSTPEGLAHHAWQLAVRNDATVIVFNCGNYERVGIRHRATQTLYLSKMIDISRFRPSYAKLHLGLQMSIVKDVLDRHQRLQATRPTPSVLGKRSRKQKQKVNLDPKSKRLKMNALKAGAIDKVPLTKGETKILWVELGKRHIALVQMCEGHLQSSVPAFCVRKGGALSSYGLGHVPRAQKKAYKPSEYLTLTLDSTCGSGATATVHTAQLQIVLSDGRKLTQGVVVKVATSEDTKKRIRHEYKVYKHLWAHRVKRIPQVYGLFEDSDQLATFLVLERVCFSFRDREPAAINAVGYLQEVTSEEK
ncbi:hypothetical protein BDN72DRAFT_884279 [Pluteus cervinus]|uniref:Uncharacterized protein n=1 Tax=Pluteus cervinus TaxID=181527 RepID=A0ACD2ZXD7_9AGAR|nr:hypothetical protein BDN72DRAFT_884279 [Pluteus cervinus]